MTINEIRRAELLQNEKFRSQELADARKRTQISADTLEETKRKNLENEQVARGELALRGATLDETKRSNLAREKEANRSNVVNEQERERHNRQTEEIGWAGVGVNVGNTILKNWPSLPKSSWTPNSDDWNGVPGNPPNNGTPWTGPSFGGTPLPGLGTPGLPTPPSTPTLPPSSNSNGYPPLNMDEVFKPRSTSIWNTNTFGETLLNIALLRKLYQSSRALGDPDYAAKHQEDIDKNPWSHFFAGQQYAGQTPLPNIGVIDDGTPLGWDDGTDSL